MRTTSVGSSSRDASSVFFFNNTPTTEIYTLSLHDALPISRCVTLNRHVSSCRTAARFLRCSPLSRGGRSEEHTSELQSRRDLVCRLLLEKKNTNDRSDPERGGCSLARCPYRTRPRQTRLGL